MCARLQSGAVVGARFNGFSAIQADTQEHAQAFDKAMIELHQIVAFVHEGFDEGKDLPVAVVQDDVEEFEVALFLDQAEHFPHRPGFDFSAGERQHLVEQRQGIAHPSVGLARDDAQRLVGGVDALALDHLLQPGGDVRYPDTPEIEPLAAGEDRRRRLLDALRLGGGEDEDHARRGLFEDLQQGVPRFPREHVRFVHDVDFGAMLGGGCVHGPLAKVAGVFNPPVRRSVDLNHIERRAAAPDERAAFALATGLALVAAGGTVERHGEDARQRRLADAAGTTEEVGVTGASAVHRPAKRLGNVFLSCDFGEASGPILAGKRGMGHGACRVSHEQASSRRLIGPKT